MKHLSLWLLLAGCAGSGSSTTPPENVTPQDDAGIPQMTGGGAPAGAACATGADCAGGTCLGAPGQPEDGNPRFTGGYCTKLGCTADSQEGCGPDEYCIDGGFNTICVALCSKADGLTCQRDGQVCLGLGSFGGCFSKDAVECQVQQHTGCQAGEVCIRIGFEDRSLGRCVIECDPLHPQCPSGKACYYIKTYNASICDTPGTSEPEQECFPGCDRCCTSGYACTLDIDGGGHHCKPYCTVATGEGCSGGQCVPIEDGAPVGACFIPGSAGTPESHH
jgi:hypothetical protein